MKSEKTSRKTLASGVIAGFAFLGFAGAAAAQADNDNERDDLDEIVVTSSRIEVPRRQIGTAVSIIDQKEIELRGFSTVVDLLRTQPGIGVSSNGGIGTTKSLRIRGEEGYRTMVIIDGVKISDPTGTQVGPNFAHLMTTSDLQRIEILRGPQGFMYGADAGGVINILTRQGRGDIGGLASAEFGAFSTQKLDGNFSAGGDSGDFFVSVTDISVDGFNVRQSDTVLADDDGYENTTLHTKLGWNATKNLRLQLVARNVDSRTEFDGCGFPSTNDCVSNTDQTTYRASADYTAGKFTHLFAVSNMSVESSNFADGIDSFSTDGDLSRVEYTGSVKPTDAMTFVYGVEFQQEEIISNGARTDRDQIGYYAEYQGKINDRFFISAGARFDDNDDFGKHTSTRVSAAYVQDLQGGATLKYRASIGTGFRAPSLFEVAYNIGPFAFPPASGVTLTEESSSGYDVGLEYRSAEGLAVELTYFDQQIEDEIFFDLSGFSGYLQALGDSQSRGVEFALEVPLHERWNVVSNLTYNDTETTDGQQRIRRPKYLANLGIRFRSSNEKLRLLANYRLSRDSVDEIFGVGRVPLEDYEVLDISGAYNVNESFEVYARLENVLDKDYQEVVGFNTPGRAGYAGVRFRF
ncbi:MAG: TonB-dependent receptor [Gammaproteobacteria bacterium]|nr:TonB-dependent receptor [Gammaproteobacteria bacterium]